VDDLALEGLDASDVGHLRLGQEPGRRDQVARRERLTTGQGDPPDVGLLVQRAPSTTVLNRMCPRTSYLSATSSAYCLISGPGVNSRDQFGFGSKKYEYVVVGTSTARPG